jgi:hypothetical protein
LDGFRLRWWFSVYECFWIDERVDGYANVHMDFEAKFVCMVSSALLDLLYERAHDNFLDLIRCFQGYYLSLGPELPPPRG